MILNFIIKAHYQSSNPCKIFPKMSTFHKIQVHLIIFIFRFAYCLLFKKIHCFIYSTTKKAIHEKLICDLSTGFFGDSPLVSGNKDRWRVYCTQHYRLPAHQHESVLDDLRYLELNSFIGVGKYEVLLEIFDKVDRRAIPVINMAWDSIRQNNETERNRQREPKPGGKHFIYLFSRHISQTNKKLSKYNTVIDCNILPIKAKKARKKTN